MWQSTEISHTRGKVLWMYFANDGVFADVAFFYKDKDGTLHFTYYDRIVGNSSQVCVNQSKSKPVWVDTPFPENVKPDYDLHEASIRQHAFSNITFISCHIANTASMAFDDRGFSRHVRKCLIGSWTDGHNVFTFHADGKYEKSCHDEEGCKAKKMIMHVPEEGFWNVARNYIFLLNNDRNSGNKMMLIDINMDEWLLPGEQGAIYWRFQRV